MSENTVFNLHCHGLYWTLLPSSPPAPLSYIPGLLHGDLDYWGPFWTTFPGQRQNPVLKSFSNFWTFPPSSFSPCLVREKGFFSAFHMQLYIHFVWKEISLFI